jgi:putative chitinase
MINATLLQTRLGVGTDGAIGPGTLTALFVKMGCPRERAQDLGLSANVHLRTYGILDTALRLAHFCAQLAHESDGFRAMEEYASGAAYEGRADLGNTQPGDGMLFKGRGPIQLTGRANYRNYGRALGIDFERHPEIVALPSVGMLVACLFWHNRDLNSLADADDVVGITQRVNGGTKGLDDRKALLVKAKALML